MNKYLLTDGSTTTKVELYIIDLLRLHLTAYEKDFPGSPEVGFDFIISDVREDELASEVKERVTRLVEKIRSSVPNTYTITIEEISIIDDRSASLIVKVNDTTSDSIDITLK